MRLFLCQYRFECKCYCTDWEYMLFVCSCAHVSIYKPQSPTHPCGIHLKISHVGAFGMIGGRSGWQVAASLFGVVKVIVFLVGVGGGGI